MPTDQQDALGAAPPMPASDKPTDMKIRSASHQARKASPTRTSQVSAEARRPAAG